jgi:hypothetical protein
MADKKRFILIGGKMSRKTATNKKISKMGLMALKALKEAVKMALEEHKRKGVPAVFMRDGKLCYLMPDGKVVHRVKDWKPSKIKK